MVFSGIDEEDPQMESFRRNGQLMDELAKKSQIIWMSYIWCTILQINLLEEINNVLSRAFLSEFIYMN